MKAKKNWKFQKDSHTDLRTDKTTVSVIRKGMKPFEIEDLFTEEIMHYEHDKFCVVKRLGDFCYEITCELCHWKTRMELVA